MLQHDAAAQVVASFDRPQLLASSLPDRPVACPLHASVVRVQWLDDGTRLLSVELQTGTSLFAGLSPGGIASLLQQLHDP